MLKHIRSAAIAAAIALFALLAASCSEPENQVRITFADGTAIPADGIELSALGSVSLKAQIRADVNADEVTWDIVGSGSGENSKAGTVAAEGVNGAVLKAGSILGASARVMAKYGDAFAEVRFKVSAGSMTLPSVGAVPPIQTGSSGTFRIELPYDAAEDPNAEWSSSAPAVASVDDEGEVTVHNDDNANSGKVATITTRYSNKDSGRTERSVDVVIEGELLPEGVTVSPSGAKEFVLGNEADASLSLTATADESATFPEIEWVSSAPSVAEVSAAGVVTPKAVGSASVAARYVMHNEIASDPVAITVRDPKIDVMAWDGASSAWAASGTVSAAWGSKLSAALANAASPLEVSLGEGDAAVPYVFDRWSAAAPAADADPSTYAGAALADGDVLDADGKEAYAVYKVKSYSVSFKVWDPAASAWADLKDGQDAAYVQAYDHGDLFDNTGVPAVAAPAGYGFAGWASFDAAPASVGAALLASGTEYVSGTTAIKAAVTLYACYISKVTVRWMSWDAGNSEWTEFCDSVQFDPYSAYVAPNSNPANFNGGDPERAFAFTGWATSDSVPASPAGAAAFRLPAAGTYANDSLSSDVTLYACYAPTKVYVKWMEWDVTNGEWKQFGQTTQFNANAAYSAPATDPASINGGDPVKLLLFDGWMENTGDGAPASPFAEGALVLPNSGTYVNAALTEDVTLYAVYSEFSYLPHMKALDAVTDFKMPFNSYDKKVTLDAFEISEYEMTQDVWKIVWDWIRAEGTDSTRYSKYSNIGTTAMEAPFGFPNNPADNEVQGKRPVENIGYDKMFLFCNALSEMHGLDVCYTVAYTPANSTCDWTKNGFRLPTESEWAYAAAGGDYVTENEPSSGVLYTYAGSNTVDDVAWHSGNSGINYNGKTHQVGLKTPNGYNLYDMSGNVSEICWDFFNSSLTSFAGGENYRGPESTNNGRVTRGGSCTSATNYVIVKGNTDQRGHKDAGEANNAVGFRVARSIIQNQGD